MADYRYYPLPPPPAPTTLAERTQMSWRWMTTGLRRARDDWATAETVADRVCIAWDAVADVLDAVLDVAGDVVDTARHTPRLLAWVGWPPLAGRRPPDPPSGRRTMNPFKALRDFVDRLIGEMSTCPECGCGYTTWREDCECPRGDCECGGTQGPDTDNDDTFTYDHPGRPAEPATGKWWLRGRCSLFCGDVNCPPNGPCQREERYLADQLPPAPFTWLSDDDYEAEFGHPFGERDESDDEACGICDQPESAHPATEWAPGGADPQDGHHYCPRGRRCPTCQDVFVPAALVIDLPGPPPIANTELP